MIRGLVTISKVSLADGRELSTQQAIDYGWVKPAQGRQPTGWDLERHEVPLGANLFVDQGRQLITYLFGFRAPVSDFACQKFGVGTGLTVARVTDVALESPIDLGGSVTKAIDFVDFVNPYVARVTFTLGVGDANGYVISEMGLFSGNDAMMARKVQAVSINKTSDFAPTLTWRIRF